MVPHSLGRSRRALMTLLKLLLDFYPCYTATDRGAAVSVFTVCPDPSSRKDTSTLGGIDVDPALELVWVKRARY